MRDAHATGTAPRAPIRARVRIHVNGRPVEADVDTRMPLVEFIRTEAHLTGTHVGCDTSQCGACTVHVDGIALKSCTLFAVQADGSAVTTIEGVSAGVEGVSADGALHPMQAAFQEHHALQCGFCTPGMIMSALDLLRRNPSPTEDDIRHGLEGNICRCTGYYNIVAAIAAVAPTLRAKGS